MIIPDEVKLLTSGGWKPVTNCIGDAIIGIPYADIFSSYPITFGVEGTNLEPKYFDVYISEVTPPKYQVMAIPPLCKQGSILAPNTNLLMSTVPSKPFYIKPQPSVFLSNVEAHLSTPNINLVNVRSPIFPTNFRKVTDIDSLSGLRYFVDWFRKLYLNPNEKFPEALISMSANWVLQLDTSINLVKAMIEGTVLKAPNWECETLPYDKHSCIKVYRCPLSQWTSHYRAILRNLAILAELPFYMDNSYLYVCWWAINSDSIDVKIPINLGELVGTKRRYYRLFRNLNETPKHEFLKYMWESTVFYKHDNRKAFLLARLHDQFRTSWPIIHKLVFEKRVGLYWDSPFLNFKIVSCGYMGEWYNVHSAIPALVYAMYPNGIIFLLSTIS